MVLCSRIPSYFVAKTWTSLSSKSQALVLFMHNLPFHQQPTKVSCVYRIPSTEMETIQAGFITPFDGCFVPNRTNTDPGSFRVERILNLAHTPYGFHVDGVTLGSVSNTPLGRCGCVHETLCTCTARSTQHCTTVGIYRRQQDRSASGDTCLWRNSV